MRALGLKTSFVASAITGGVLLGAGLLFGPGIVSAADPTPTPAPQQQQPAPSGTPGTQQPGNQPGQNGTHDCPGMGNDSGTSSNSGSGTSGGIGFRGGRGGFRG